MKRNFSEAKRLPLPICLTVLLSAVLLFSGCGAKMSDGEAREILSELIPKSQEINLIFFGEGLPLENPDAVPMETVTGAQYYRVSEKSPYQTVEQVKTAAQAVYTAAYLTNSVYPAAFDGIDDLQPRYREEDGVLSRDITVEGFPLLTVFDVDSATVIDTGYQSVTVRIDYTSGENTEVRQTTLSLRQQNGVWLLDSPTY